MKVKYTVNFFGKEVSGVQKKILSQVMNLNALGVPSEIYSLTGTDDTSPSLPYVSKITIPGLECDTPGTFFAKIRRNALRDSSISTIMQMLTADEILYTRMLSRSRITSKLLKRPRRCKIVIEYQSIEPNESRLDKDYVSLLYDFLYGDDIRRYTDGIVGVTDEITDYEVSRSGDPDKPHITIGNGFNVDSVTVRQQVPFVGEELHLLCVANVSRWHGLDRLIRGLGTYRGPTRITLHIAGDGSELSSLKKIIDELGITGQVIFHGFTTGKDLDDLFNTCHIAVGSLGLHRIGLTEASILKAREYCARGIPYIIACKDPDFPNDFSYIHTVPADESPVSIESIIDFAQRVSEDIGHPLKMREYAVGHLDWSVKMKILKTFLETLVDGSK
jgi:glycosyltransferase involved in cell wall biosynthesis